MISFRSGQSFTYHLYAPVHICCTNLCSFNSCKNIYINFICTLLTSSKNKMSIIFLIEIFLVSFDFVKHLIFVVEKRRILLNLDQSIMILFYFLINFIPENACSHSYIVTIFFIFLISGDQKVIEKGCNFSFWLRNVQLDICFVWLN